jgi:hypothetical protein
MEIGKKSYSAWEIYTANRYSLLQRAAQAAAMRASYTEETVHTGQSVIIVI